MLRKFARPIVTLAICISFFGSATTVDAAPYCAPFAVSYYYELHRFQTSLDAYYRYNHVWFFENALRHLDKAEEWKGQWDSCLAQ